MSRSRGRREAAATAPTAVVAPIRCELVDRRGHGTAVVAEFRYLAEDPWAVGIGVPTTAGPIVWRFGRELLAEGTFEPTGDGDVHVWPSLSATGESVTLVELCGSRGRSVHLEVPSRDVLQFLGAAADVVAPGAESAYVDLERLVDDLLGPTA